VGRRLGQHFLRSPGIIEKLAEAACPTREHLVVEIGPGEGVLTQALLPRTDRLIAIELDDTLVPDLHRRFPTIEIVHSDVLKTDLKQWGPAAVAGNLPYYITSPIIDHVLAMGPLLRHAILMMQREVADRLVAQPGSRDFGFLTIATQARAQVEFLFPVPKGAFAPPPKVESAVVRLTPLPSPIPANFLNFASLCFRHKRKTLRNNLAAEYPAIRDLTEGSLRAEQLPLEDLKSLYARLVS
jgi:16S rRNA (adenine1518-N6/adenine1519-N6)-dimethyltransferase